MVHNRPFSRRVDILIVPPAAFFPMPWRMGFSTRSCRIILGTSACRVSVGTSFPLVAFPRIVSSRSERTPSENPVRRAVSPFLWPRDPEKTAGIEQHVGDAAVGLIHPHEIRSCRKLHGFGLHHLFVFVPVIVCLRFAHRRREGS